MGIKYLWTILSPFCDRKPLYELQGKTVAVDLSCWICEAQNIADYQVQPRMYLRNLYFRTCYLLLMDVNPVFVLEGKAPELKYDTIAARNDIQFKGSRPKTDGVKTGKDRSRFHFVLKQCEDMLGYMGLACIKGSGEAESLCAYLNEDGLVDGCISQDSDCFAYGAQVVYRNFSISAQGAQAASGGAVDVYDIRKANQSLKFGRNKIIAMALLIGCDYSEGVHGIGKDSVMKFFETVSNDEVLDKLRSWRSNKKMYENHERQLANKNICTSCGHSGKIQSHSKIGCISCKTSKGCDPFKYKEQRLHLKNEITMRNKAIQVPDFPNEMLIKEFLEKKDDVKKLDLTWKQPNLVGFIKFTGNFLEWGELYSFEKFLPILTRWQCRNPELLRNENKLRGVLVPDRIKKIRNPKGVPSYEIIWSDPKDYFKGLIPEEQIQENNVDVEKLWSTIEPQILVDKAYPELVESFKQSKIKPKKTTKRKKNEKRDLDQITDNLANISITQPKPKRSRKPRAGKGQKTIEDALKLKSNQAITEPYLNEFPEPSISINENKKVMKTIENTVIYDLDSSFKQLTIEKQESLSKPKTFDCFAKKSEDSVQSDVNVENNVLRRHFSTPAKHVKANLSLDFDVSACGGSDFDLSDIVDNIVARREVQHHFKNIADKYVQGLGEINLEGSFENQEQLETSCRETVENSENANNEISSFFTSNFANDNDLFEKTFNATFKNFSDSGSETEEYEYDVDELNTGSKNEDSNRKKSSELSSGCKDELIVCLDSENDSFCDEYVPLYDRIKNK